MLSRTADHLFWMSRYTERAQRVRSFLPCLHKEAAC
ncbi:alpha-E domain-containing protein [Acidovorax radicis]|nr:alpha-E domain-containing protein [Acidovorax radicis]UCV00691.1 alpha-E domain-containing protein [Acidovorax radicis]